MSTKKILIRIGSLRHGGAEKVLITFLKNIPKNKYQIDLLLNLKSGKYLSEVPDWINLFYLNEGEMITTNKPWEIPQKAYRKIYQGILKLFPKLLYKFILKKEDYDIELIANHSLLQEVLKSPVKTSKKVVWVHNDLFSIPEYKPNKLIKFFKADKIWVISDKIKDDFQKLARNSIEKEKLIKIYNPIDSDEIVNKAKEKIEFDFSEYQEKTFVAIGTVFPQKGFDRLIKVHKKLLEEGLYHKIIIVGDGYDFIKIKNLIKKLNLEKTIKMAEFQKNPYPFLKNTDYFILSSRYEGYPTVLFEALTLKKPIIATNVSGVKEILHKGELGMIVENSEDGIYNGMKKFLTDSHIPDQYIEKMNKKELPFSLENAVNSLLKILDNL
ncbi:glycosyltransferase [Apibacter adventoris]|uniref:Glycosyl transferase n=1 Tax=Apibacter adventoris TaxID=1679466 RepID=A0A2S8ADR2_9FLAO|nr:glycosyltransferase [Apibacter adventoris]PQL93079.1 glycosyl transferase [Apibacter adventoris]